MLSYFLNRISIFFVWMGKNDVNALPVDVYFFASEGKKLSVFKTIWILVACESIRFCRLKFLVSPAEKNGGREATTGNTSTVRRLTLRQTVNVRFKLNDNFSKKKVNS